MVVTGLLLACLSGANMHAQSTARSGPRVAAGLLGAAQQSAFRVTEGTVSFEQQIGWAAGIWLTVPLGRFFSIEPQVQYSSMPSLQAPGTRSRAFLADATVTWLSAPLVLKVHLGPLAITAGGQVDYPIAVVDDPNLIARDHIPQVTYAATGGVELFPRSRVTLYGRYVYGFTNIDGRELATPSAKLYNQTVQAGLKLRLVGGRRSRSRATDTTPAEAAEPSTGKEPTGKESTGKESTGKEPTGKESTGKEPTGKESTGKEPTGRDSKAAKSPTPETPASIDIDGDKVADASDKCPTVFGVERNAGCPMPDVDDDGVTDEFDKCPQTPGRVQSEGCVFTDTDKDGVSDDDDRCPTVAGTSQFGGCTTPDADKDGVFDADDRCPAVAGVAEMRGCPRIGAFSASAVTFASGLIALTPEGRRELGKVFDYLVAYPNVSVRLEGHTDSMSGALINNPLSARRAMAARAYLLSRGVADARITTIGHGSARPAIGNGTAGGRAKNRRVEVIVR